MPELPEVETTIRGLKPIVNSTILNIKIHTPKLRILIPKNILLIKRVKIQNIKRIGKLIIIHLENSYSIVFHLGMSGRIRLYRHDHYIKQKHDHFIAKTNNGYYFVLNDSRRFGFVDFEKTSKVFMDLNSLFFLYFKKDTKTIPLISTKKLFSSGATKTKKQFIK